MHLPQIESATGHPLIIIGELRLHPAVVEGMGAHEVVEGEEGGKDAAVVPPGAEQLDEPGKRPPSSRAKNSSTTPRAQSRRRTSSSFSSPVRMLEAMPRSWKFCRMSSLQKAWIVLICARPSSSCWRRRRAFSGCSAASAATRAMIRCFISSAAALEKVTTSSRSASTGCPGSRMRPTARSTSTAVLPEPAAAETSTVPPRASIASRCRGVH